MKLYLILLAVSIIAEAIVGMEIRLRIKRNYKTLYVSSIAEQILAYIKMVILTAMIVPNILSLLCDLFAHETFIESVDKCFENSERFEKKIS